MDYEKINKIFIKLTIIFSILSSTLLLIFPILFGSIGKPPFPFAKIIFISLLVILFFSISFSILYFILSISKEAHRTKFILNILSSIVISFIFIFIFFMFFYNNPAPQNKLNIEIKQTIMRAYDSPGTFKKSEELFFSKTHNLISAQAITEGTGILSSRILFFNNNLEEFVFENNQEQGNSFLEYILTKSNSYHINVICSNSNNIEQFLKQKEGTEINVGAIELIDFTYINKEENEYTKMCAVFPSRTD